MIWLFFLNIIIPRPNSLFVLPSFLLSLTHQTRDHWELMDDAATRHRRPSTAASSCAVVEVSTHISRRWLSVVAASSTGAATSSVGIAIGLWRCIRVNERVGPRRWRRIRVWPTAFNRACVRHYSPRDSAFVIGQYLSSRDGLSLQNLTVFFFTQWPFCKSPGQILCQNSRDSVNFVKPLSQFVW